MTSKAGLSTVETRDTADPGLISSMLAALLEANGRRVSPTTLKKRVHDDVLWNSADMPWRRLPFWLTLRVTLQRHLCDALGADRGRLEYKFLQCVIHLHLLKDVTITSTIDGWLI